MAPSGVPGRPLGVSLGGRPQDGGPVREALAGRPWEEGPMREEPGGRRQERDSGGGPREDPLGRGPR